MIYFIVILLVSTVWILDKKKKKKKTSKNILAENVIDFTREFRKVREGLSRGAKR